MNLWGSIRNTAAAEVRRLRSQNETLRSARPAWWLRPIRLLLGRRSLAGLLGAYGLIWGIIVAAGALITIETPASLAPFVAELQRSETIRNLLSYLLGAQATMVGLIFPLALGMVTLIVQRDEGAATNTDIQLYYDESLAYSVGTSGLTLAIALVLALLSPETLILDLLGRAAVAWSVSAAILTLLSLWLLLNLVVTWHFLVTSLSFINPRFRAAARKRFVASRVIPRHLAGILSRYRNVSLHDTLFPEPRETMPLVMVGIVDEIAGERSVSTSLRRERALRDVRLKPLRWAVSMWAWRSRRAGVGPTNDRYDWMLALAGPIDRTMRGDVLLARRKGGIPLRWTERWLIRRSFVFAKPVKSDQLGPAEILAELADRVIVQIDRLAVTGFEHALEEMTGFHRFLLTSHTLVDEDGNATSLAAYGDLFAEHSSWVREYRRLFERAIAVLERDDAFIGKLAFIALELTPDPGKRVPPAIVAGLYDLPQFMVHRVGHWLAAQRTSGGIAHPRRHGPLPPQLARIYRSAAMRMVGAHESALDAGARYGRVPAGVDDQEAWSRLTSCWPILFRHLVTTAYLLVASHWHEDEIAAELYLESFLAWRGELHDIGDEDYRHILRTAFLSQDLVDADWAGAALELQSSLHDRRWAQATPSVVFSALVANLHADVRALTALILAGWAGGPTPVAEAGRSAKNLAAAIAPREGDLALDLVRTFARLKMIDWGSQQSGYRASLDDVVRSFDSMIEKERVPGRVYSVDTRSRVSDLTPQWFALVAAMGKADSFARIEKWLADLGGDEPAITMSDDILWQLMEWLKRTAQRWSEPATRPELTAGIQALDPILTADAAGDALHDALTGAARTIEENRDRRLVAMPISQDVMRALEARATDKLRELGSRLTFFPSVKIGFVQGREIRTSFKFRNWDKREVVDAPVKRRGEDFIETAGDRIAGWAVNRVWRPYFRLRRRRVTVDSPQALFEAAAREGTALAKGGIRPILLLPTRHGNWPDLFEAKRDFGNEIDRREEATGRSDYLYSFRGVDFYRSGLEHAELMASDFLEQVVFSAPNPDAPVAFSAKAEADPTDVMIVGKFAVRAIWADREVVRFVRRGRRHI